MPICKNGKVVLSRFKAQSLILIFVELSFTKRYLEEFVTP